MKDTMKHLLNHGFRSKYDKRLFVMAIKGRETALRGRLKKGQGEVVSNDTFGLGFSLLHVAGTPEIIRCLLEHGINIDIQDKRGNTPLHYHALEGNAEIVAYLLEQGATPEIQNDLGQTPLQLATTLRTAELISGKKMGVTPEQLDISIYQFVRIKRLSIIQKFLEFGFDSRLQNTGISHWHRQTLLEYAMKHESYLVAIMFLEQIESTIQDHPLSSNTYYPIVSLATKYWFPICTEILQRVLKMGTDPEGYLHWMENWSHQDTGEYYRIPPIYKARRNNDWPKTDLLLRYGANPDNNPAVSGFFWYKEESLYTYQDMKTDSQGNTALHYVASKKRTNPCDIKRLLEDGLNPNQPNKEGKTPLHYAVNHCRTGEKTKHLLAFGADPTLMDVYGNTPYYYALSSWHERTRGSLWYIRGHMKKHNQTIPSVYVPSRECVEEVLQTDLDEIVYIKICYIPRLREKLGFLPFIEQEVHVFGVNRVQLAFHPQDSRSFMMEFHRNYVLRICKSMVAEVDQLIEQWKSQQNGTPTYSYDLYQATQKDPIMTKVESIYRFATNRMREEMDALRIP